MSMWKEEQLARSLVYQHLKTTSPALACEFKIKYKPQRTNLQWKEVLSKWREDQLARNLVYNHLKLVAPSLAVEFKNKYMSWLIEQRTLIKICMSILGNLSKHEIGNIHQNLLSSKKCLSPEGSLSSGEQDSEDAFRTEEVEKTRRASTSEKKVVTVAVELKRGCNPRQNKITECERAVMNNDTGWFF